MLWQTVISLFILILWVFVFYKYGLGSDLKRYWFAMLAVKLIFGAAAYFLYFEYYDAGDMVRYFEDARIYEQAGNWPNPFSRIIPLELQPFNQMISERNALFFARAMAFIYMLMGQSWLVVIFFSVLSTTIAFYALSFFLKQKEQKLINSPALIFLVIPSLLFWTSGVFKEAIAFPIILLVLGISSNSYRSRSINWIEIIVVSISLIILWYVKYFLAGLSLIFLFGLFNHTWLKSLGISQWICFIISLLALIIPLTILGSLHFNLSLTNLWVAIYDTHQKIVLNSQPDVLLNFTLTNNWVSVLDDIPKAILSGLFFPLPWQSWNTLSLLVSLENGLAGSFFVYGLYIIIKDWKRIEISPFHLWLFIFIMIGAILIAVATPNMGTLSRYKVVYYPFLLYLLLDLLQSRAKPSHSTT